MKDNRSFNVSSSALSTQSRISILIVDSMRITSELLEQAFLKHPQFEVLACTGTMEDMARALTQKQPDIVLIQCSDKKGASNPLAVLDKVSSLCPSARSIVIASNLTRENVVTYFRAQARGILAADLTDFATLCKCITCVYRGQIWANSEQLGYLVESLSGTKSLRIVDSKGEAILSTREEEVLRLLADGLSNREMAASLNLSEHTIKNHLFHIFDKLGVSSRTEAILYAMSRRMVAR
jgi:DNA-binding NarL/FixJ family response regulator